MKYIFLIVVGFLGCALYSWASVKEQDYIAKKTADELERRQKEKDNQKKE